VNGLKPLAPDTPINSTPPEEREKTANLSGRMAALFNPRLFRRILLFLVGNFVLAMGVSMAVKSDLGITPVNSIAYVSSRIFYIDHGLMTAIVYCGYVLFQFIILGKEFRLYSFLQMGVAILFGGFVSLTNRIFSFPAPEAYWIRFLLMLASIVVLALGILLYLRANLMPQPADGLLLAVQKKTGWKLGNSKVILDIIILAVALTLSLIAAGKIIGIREGTLLAILGVGKTIGFISGWLGPKIDALFKL